MERKGRKYVQKKEREGGNIINEARGILEWERE